MEFYIDISRSGEIEEKFKEMIKEMHSYEKGLLRISNEISKIPGFEEMEETVAILYEEVHSEKQDLERMLDTYKKCVQCYKDTEKKLVSSEIFDGHMLLDIGGLVPGIGMVCDGINAGWYAVEKDWGNALLSGVSFIPAVGEISGIGKVGAKAISHADDIADIAKAAERAGDTAKVVDDVADVSKYLDDTLITLKHQATSGVELTSTPGKTTTILGRYASDTGDIIKELDLPKSTEFGGNPGGFNLLNTPDDLYMELGAEGFWNEYNKPFLDAAISRGDEIIMATPINNSNLYLPGTMELTGFGREYFYLLDHGYEYIDGRMMIKK